MPFEVAAPAGGPDRAALWRDHTQSGPAWCRSHTQIVDGWLAALFQDAIDSVRRGAGDDFALVAVGGYGRAELAPHSDIDVWLLHNGSRAAKAVSERLWYPVWDAGIKLGHGVATPKELLRLAETDLDTATTVLSARPVAGNADLAASAGTGGLRGWQSRAPRWLDELGRRTQERWRQSGEVAFLLEPDLKDGRGGLRDVHTMRWIQSAGFLQHDTDEPALAAAHDLLLDVRVALHLITGRPSNVLNLQEQAQVAAALGHDGPEELMAAVAAAARTIAWLADDVLRRVASAIRGPARGAQQRERALVVGAKGGDLQLPFHSALLSFEVAQQLATIVLADGRHVGTQAELPDAVVGFAGVRVDAQGVVQRPQPAGVLAVGLLDEPRGAVGHDRHHRHERRQRPLAAPERAEEAP